MKNIYAHHEHHHHVVPCPSCHRTLFRSDIKTPTLGLLLKSCLCHGNAEYAKLRAEVAEGKLKQELLLAEVRTLKEDLARAKAKRPRTEAPTAPGLSSAARAACQVAAAEAEKNTPESVAKRTRSNK
jgi:hypothetical protein